jgi:phosphatidylserine/phosphatidylglycerophosphate/cardiolipin synthase-like enzyme
MKRAGLLAMALLIVVAIVGTVGASTLAPAHVKLPFTRPTTPSPSAPASTPAADTPGTAAPTTGAPGSNTPGSSTPVSTPGTSTPGSSAAPPSATPSGNVPRTTAPPPQTNPGAGPPALVTGARTSAGVVTFPQTFTYTDGVRVQVTKIKRSERTKKDIAVGVKRGAPVQTLTVRVTNGSAAPLSLTQVLAAMNYGGKHKVAPVVRRGTPKPMVAILLPGRALTGTFSFAVPQKSIHNATLRLTIDPNHSPAVFTGSLGYSPGNGSVFNDPNSSTARQNAIINHIERSIEGAPKGSTIRIAQYSFDVKQSADKLLAAHRRGVHIQMIVDQHEDLVTSETRRLMNALGTKKKHRSFLVRCKASCMSSRTSAMHAKFYLFSQVGNSRYVSMISSANITHTNSGSSWNDIQTVVGNKVIYDSLAKYLKDMAPDKNRPGYFHTVASGPYQLWFFPRGRGHGGRSALLTGVLNKVTCTGAAPGFGTKEGHTIVRVGMYSWTSDRIDIARKLWKLHNKGCKVQIIYNSGRTSSRISFALLKHSKKYGQLSLHDAWRDRNHNNSPEQYMHEKDLMINGVWNGHNTKVVYAGSQNFTPNATLDNNDLIFRNSTPSTYDAYAENFKEIMDDTPRLRHYVRGFQHDPEDSAE